MLGVMKLLLNKAHSNSSDRKETIRSTLFLIVTNVQSYPLQIVPLEGQVTGKKQTLTLASSASTPDKVLQTSVQNISHPSSLLFSCHLTAVSAAEEAEQAAHAVTLCRCAGGWHCVRGKRRLENL